MQSPADWPYYVQEEFQNASTAEELAKVCVFIKFHIKLDKEKLMEFKARRVIVGKKTNTYICTSCCLLLSEK
jgi:hypothetical protein